MAKQQSPQPPQPPPFERRTQIPAIQMVGIPLLLLLPVLALVGVFGHATDSATTSNDVLALEVTYPTRTRHNLAAELVVEVGNLSAEPITVTLDLDRSYLDRFAEHVFLPEAQEVRPDVYRVEVSDIPPGEARIVRVGLRAEQYWRLAGQATASLDGSSPVSVPLRTWVYP